MAWPKVFDEILDRLERIEAKINEMNSGTILSTVEETVKESSEEPSSILGNYDDLSAADVIRRSKNLTRSQKLRLSIYEKDHKNRQVVLDALSKE